MEKQGRGQTAPVVIIPDDTIDIVLSEKAYNALMQLPECYKIKVYLGRYAFGDAEVINGRPKLTFYNEDLRLTDDTEFDFKGVDALYFSAILERVYNGADTIDSLILSQSTLIMKKVKMVRVNADLEVRENIGENTETQRRFHLDTHSFIYNVVESYDSMHELCRDSATISEVIKYAQHQISTLSSIVALEKYSADLEFALRERDRLLKLQDEFII